MNRDLPMAKCTGRLRAVGTTVKSRRNETRGCGVIRDAKTANHQPPYAREASQEVPHAFP